MLSATIVTFGAMVGVIGSIGLVRRFGKPRRPDESRHGEKPPHREKPRHREKVWQFGRPGGTDDSRTALTDAACSKQYPELKADLVDQIASGHFAADHSGIMLGEGEQLLIRIPLVSYCAQRAARRNAVTFPIAPALRVQTDGTGPAEGDEITELDCDDFALTSRRIIFIGGAKSVDFPLSKIIQIEATEDQIALTRRGRKKAEYFVGVDKFTASASPPTADGRAPATLTFYIEGPDLKQIILKQTILNQTGRDN